MDQYYQIKNEVNSLEIELNKLKNNKNKTQDNIQELEEASKHSMQYINKKEKELNNLEININRIEVKLDHLLLNLSEDYNMTYEYAKENYILEIDEEQAREEVRNYKDIIKNIRNVNLGAIEEFERVNIELLKQRREDLKKELQKVSKGKKITRAYMAQMPETYSSIDIKE